MSSSIHISALWETNISLPAKIPVPPFNLIIERTSSDRCYDLYSKHACAIREGWNRHNIR